MVTRNVYQKFEEEIKIFHLLVEPETEVNGPFPYTFYETIMFFISETDNYMTRSEN